MPPTRIPFSGMVQNANVFLDTPVGKWIGRAFVIGIGTAVLYAGKAKLHEEISIDPNVVSAMTRALAAEHKASAIDQLLTAHSTEITALHSSDEALKTSLEEIGKTVQHTDLVLATVSQRQEDGQRQQREDIRRLDTTLNALAAKR